MASIYANVIKCTKNPYQARVLLGKPQLMTFLKLVKPIIDTGKLCQCETCNTCTYTQSLIELND